MVIMRFLVLFPILGLALGSKYSPLRIDQEYTQHFTSQLLTGIPELNSQYAGHKIVGKMVFQPQERYTWKIQLQETKYKAYNDVLKLSEQKDILDEDVIDVPVDIKKHLEAPFILVVDKTYNNEKIIVDSDEPVYIVNMKKGIVSRGTMMLDLTLPTMLDTNSIQRNEEQRKIEFTRMETTIDGDCEVQYNINKLPEALAIEFENKEMDTEASKLCQGEDYYEILRTKNLQKCSGRPIFQQSYGLNAKSDGSMGATSPVIAESFLERRIVCGTLKDHIWRKITVESKKITSAHGDVESKEKLEVYSKMTYTVKSIGPFTSKIKDIVNPISLPLHFQFPFSNIWTSKVSELGSKAKLNLPDMTSTRNGFLPYPSDGKEVFVETFLKFVELAKKSPESSPAAEDATQNVLKMTDLALIFSIDDINEVWTNIVKNINHNIAYKQNAELVYLDILSIVATNPCVRYISDIVKNERVVGEQAAWIVANMIKSAKTPTEALIEELTDLLKHPVVQSSEALRATVAMSLTELVHKACIDETSSVHDYPKIFGPLCNKESKVIKTVLLPFLVEKLEEHQYQLQREEPSSTSMNSAIVLINALGNIGLPEASHPLLEVIEGKLTTHPHPRSVAVYKLIRFARANPSVYRPVLLAIIQNVAENEEVRMAAISVLPYTLPSSKDMEKMAIRTWFESSQQVASYITSTLKTLKDLPLQAPLYQKIAQKAEAAYKFAKPINTGIQTSHNLKIVQFLDTLRAAVQLKLQYVNSEESAIPRTMYVKSDVHTKSHAMEMLDSAVYIQGTEELIEKMYNTYTKIQGQQPLMQEQESVLDIKNRMVKQPEAHVTLKMMGLQRFYTIDSQMIQGIIRELTEEFYNDGQSRGITKNFLKVIDIHGYNNIVPTELGIPLYVRHRTPVVVSIHASLVMVKNGEVEIKIKPVVNYKQVTTVGFYCPFRKDYLGAGAETSLHVTLPLRADVGLQHGQLSVTLKTPVDAESQKVKPVVEFRVVPFTKGCGGTETGKIIHSQHNEKKKVELQLGEHVGLDLKLQIESEHKFVDLASFLEQLSHHHPLTLLTLPLPPMTVASHSISLIYNPTTSLTKQASFVMSFGHGKKMSVSEKPSMIYPLYQVDQEIETKCNEEQECMKEMFCNKEKQHCLKELRKQNRPTSEINKYCSTKFSQCSQRHVLRQNIRSVLNQLESGSAVTVNMIASLHGEHDATIRQVETHFTVGHRPPHHKAGEKSKTQISTSFKIAPGAQPFDLDIDLLGFMEKPIFAWDIHGILQQNLKAEMKFTAGFGFRGQEQTSIVAKVKAKQSKDQKLFAEHSEITKRCIADLEVGLVSSAACKEARQHAASLDIVEADIKIPGVISQSPVWISLQDKLKLYFLPYLSISKVESEYEYDQYVLLAKIDQLGKKMTLNVENNWENIEIKDVRIAKIMQGLLPISTKDNLLLNVVQKLTLHGAPSVCSVQGNKVSTFDKLVYDYELNDCEHVVFKDCSPSNLVEVSVKKDNQAHIVKVVLAGTKYELELPRPIRSARSTPSVIKVNGEQKTIQQKGPGKQHEFVELEQNYYEDAHTYLTSYKDGVYAIVSKLYGIAVYADGISLEVRTFQHSLRNQVCGLCGDLNDEKTADMKTADLCIMSSPQLAAYSYMVQDKICKGIPAEQLNQFKTEAAKCAKKIPLPTKVTEVLHQKKPVAMKHLVEETSDKACISKKQIPVCGASVVPKEVVMEEVPFFCVPLDTDGATLMRIAEYGDKIQNIEEYPTVFVKKVSHPIKC